MLRNIGDKPHSHMTDTLHGRVWTYCIARYIYRILLKGARAWVGVEAQIQSWKDWKPK